MDQIDWARLRASSPPKSLTKSLLNLYDKSSWIQIWWIKTSKNVLQYIYIYKYKIHPTYFSQMIEESLILPHPTACTTPANNFDVRKGKTCL